MMSNYQAPNGASAAMPADSFRQALVSETIPFIQALTGVTEDEAWFVNLTFQTFDDKKPDGTARKSLVRVLHGGLDECAEDLRKLNDQGAGVFISVNETDFKGRKKENITTGRAWWADVDQKLAEEPLDLSLLPHPPSMVVETGRGNHLYWLPPAPMPLDNKERQEQHEVELQAVRESLATVGSDPKVCQVACVLRLPGFKHCKAEPRMVKVVSISDQRYTQEEIQAAFCVPATPKVPLLSAAPAQPPQHTAHHHQADPSRLETLLEAENYLNGIPGSIAGEGGNADGGTKTFTDALKLIRKFDLTQEEALDLMCKAYNPRCQPPWSDAELSHKVGDAYWAVCASRIEEQGRPRVPGFTWDPSGLWIVMRQTKAKNADLEDGGEEVVEWLASPFTLTGLIRDGRSSAWSLGMAWKDLDGVLHEQVVPLQNIAGEGADVFRPLAEGGLLVSPSVRHRKLVLTYLTAAVQVLKSGRRAKLVDTPGWHDNAFVLPDGQVIGSTNEDLKLVATTASSSYPKRGGTFETWKEQVAAHAIGEPFLAFGLSAALAGHILHHLRPDGGGGFNLQGGSSKGKTTILEVGNSTWSHPSSILAWRSTANGLEGTAASRNDGFLPLDEIGLVKADDLAAVTYMLANGTTKLRANRDGNSRKVKVFRLIFLSTGELGLEAKLREGNIKIRAGQEVRFPDIPCPADGMFKDHHGFLDDHELPSKAVFADHLKTAVRTHYGHASPAFLEAIAKLLDEGVDVTAKAKELEASWMKAHVGGNVDSQVRRVAGRFALVAVAGELARELGVLPWPEGEASRAAAHCFEAWLNRRGFDGPAELTGGIKAVLAFLDKHGSSRFVTWGDKDSKAINCAGARKPADGKAGDDLAWDYYLSATGWQEACEGFVPKDIAEACVDAGLLVRDGGGKSATSKTVPGLGRGRYYILRASAVAVYREKTAQ